MSDNVEGRSMQRSRDLQVRAQGPNLVDEMVVFDLTHTCEQTKHLAPSEFHSNSGIRREERKGEIATYQR